VWQEYYEDKSKILTDYPHGALAFILLPHEQQLAEKIDHSFGPSSLTGMYLMTSDHTFETEIRKIDLNGTNSSHTMIRTMAGK
jgi:hypothetical protein